MRDRDYREARNDGENRDNRARPPRAIAPIRTRSASRKQHPGEIAPGEHNISSRKLDGSAFGGSRAIPPRRAGFPLAALLWRPNGASAT